MAHTRERGQEAEAFETNLDRLARLWRKGRKRERRAGRDPVGVGRSSGEVGR